MRSPLRNALISLVPFYGISSLPLLVWLMPTSFEDAKYAKYFTFVLFLSLSYLGQIWIITYFTEKKNKEVKKDGN